MDKFSEIHLENSEKLLQTSKHNQNLAYIILFISTIFLSYGFYIFFSFAKDIHFVAMTVDANLNIMSSNLMSTTDSIGQLSANHRHIALSIESIKQDVKTLEPMLKTFSNIENALSTPQVIEKSGTE